MRYKKYEIGPYNLHIIKTDKFKRVKVQINFKRLVKKEEITKRVILNEILFESSAKYKNKRELNIECENLYSLKAEGKSKISGNYIIMSFTGSFLNEKYTESGMNEKSLDFIMDVIFNPDIENNEFNKESLQLVKNDLKQQIMSISEDPVRYSVMRLMETVDSKSAISYHNEGYLEDFDNITPQNLYEYYLDVMKSDTVDIFICGEVDDIDVKKMISQYLKIKTIKKPTGTHFINHSKIRSRTKVFKEQKPINQSQLMLAYKLIDLTDFEISYVLPIYSFILGGGPDAKLFKNVREKHSLCYSIHSNILQVKNLMIISAGISLKNYRKALLLIKKEVSNMHKNNFTDDDVDNAILSYINSVKEVNDSQKSLIDLYVSKEYLNTDTIDERIKNIKKVNRDMINKLAKKIFIDSVYLLEGSADDEKATS